jgi:hypothetical protein
LRVEPKFAQRRKAIEAGQKDAIFIKVGQAGLQCPGTGGPKGLLQACIRLSLCPGVALACV